MLPVNYNDITQYKKCRKKLYNIYACLPPAGTIVINKLEQPQAVKALGNREFFNHDELVNMLCICNPLLHTLTELCGHGMVYKVCKGNEVVLRGTVGEMWTISLDKLIKSYDLASGGAITSEYLKKNGSVINGSNCVG